MIIAKHLGPLVLNTRLAFSLCEAYSMYNTLGSTNFCCTMTQLGTNDRIKDSLKLTGGI